MLIVASLFMVTSLFSCGGQGNKPGTPAKTGEEFVITFGVEPADKAKIEAKVDNKLIKSGDKVAKNKEVVFTLSNVAKGYEPEKWEGDSVVKVNETTAKLKVTKACKVTAKLKTSQQGEKARNTITFSTDPENAGIITATIKGKNITVNSNDTIVVEGDVVEVTVTPKDASKEFEKWVSSEVSITNPKEKTVTFTMPNVAVILKAQFKKNGGDTKEDSELKLTKLEYKKADNSKEDITTTKAFTVENGVKTLAKTDFTATFEYGDGTNKKTEPIDISSIKKSDGTELSELQEGENKITLVVDAKQGSYKGTSIPVTVTRKPDPNADPKLTLIELKYKDGENIKDTLKITVENDVEEVQSSDFKAKFKDHENENITFNTVIDYNPGDKLLEGENTITITVDAVKGSYAETQFQITVIRKAKLKLESLKIWMESVVTPAQGDWTVSVPKDKVKVEPSNVEAMFTWKGQETPQKLDVTVEPADHTLSETPTSLTLKVAKTDVYKEWEGVVKVTHKKEGTHKVFFEVTPKEAGTIIAKIKNENNQKVEIHSGEEVKKGTEVTFVVKLTNSLDPDYEIAEWIGATQHEKYKKNATVTVGDSDVNVTAKLKLIFAEITELKIVPVNNTSAVLQKLTQSELLNARISDVNTGYDYGTFYISGEKVKFVLQIDPPDATVEYFPPALAKLGTDEGHQFDDGRNFVDIAVSKPAEGKIPEYKKQKYSLRFDVKQPLIKCTEIKLGDAYTLDEDDVKTAAESEGFDYTFEAEQGTLPIKVKTYPQDAQVSITGGNVSNGEFTPSTTEEKVTITLTKSGYKSATYILKLKKAKPAEKHELKELKIGSKKLTADDLAGAVDTNGFSYTYKRNPPKTISWVTEASKVTVKMKKNTDTDFVDVTTQVANNTLNLPSAKDGGKDNYPVGIQIEVQEGGKTTTYYLTIEAE